MLIEYFRAPDRATAVKAGRRGLAGGRRLDGFRAGLMPEVEMAKLLALAHDRPWSVDLLETEEIWPRRWILRSRYDGPFIAELSASSGPQFAGIPDRALPGLVTRWAQIEELSRDSHIAAGDYTHLQQAAVAIIGLARRAQEAGDRLYVRIAP